jgi:hypothetical protein
METRLHICRCVLDDAAERGKGAMLKGRGVGAERSDEAGAGTTEGAVSIEFGTETSRCKEKAG